MKRANKLIALFLAIIMAFSMLTLPAFAVDTSESVQTETEPEQNETNNIIDTIGSIFDAIKMILETVHEIVGSILAAVGEDCPLCGEMHINDAEQEPEEDNLPASEAEEYYRNNGELLDIIDAETSEDVFTEEDIILALEDRGFDAYPVTYDHYMNGERIEDTEITDATTEKHPMYQTFFAAENGEVWVIYVINGEIFASPFNFNMESDLGVQLLVSESQELTSYDNESNKFFITIPDSSSAEVSVLTIDKLDAETLESLSIEELCNLTGASIPETDSEDVAISDNENESSNLSVETFAEIERVGASETTLASNSTTADPFIVVSLGDSYSSGEGIPPFYDQDKDVYAKVKDYDWLAHRSTKSWPSLLTIPGVTNNSTLSNYKIDDTAPASTSPIQWYFVASSGATTSHFNSTQNKPYDQDVEGFWDLKDSEPLPAQLSVFEKITGNVDYVTLTIGGNDVDFAGIIMTCAINCAYLYFNEASELEDKLNALWNNISKTAKKIKTAYMDINEKTRGTAEIIVAGYPQLLEPNGAGWLINKKEATLVNEKVSDFNDIIQAIVTDCHDNENIKIHFVDVETIFDGHQAYSNDAWINELILPAKEQDLKQDDIYSQYSIHPNEKGAKAYAECVNAKIAELESGTLSGKICKASDRTTPVPEAQITIIDDSTCSLPYSPNSNGNYSIGLPAGQYQVKITADGYIDFDAYARIERDKIVYMETFLLVEGEEEQIGTASGTVFNALSGSGVENATLVIRRGWNNTNSESDIIAITETNSNGHYSVDLNLGNYTVYVLKENYVPESFNIIVQNGTTGNQNGTITPIISGNDYLITLTWDENPRDLDSHMVGTLSDGSSFHVYYSHKSQMDGSVEVCNLDYDDTSSYGPEHITLKANTSSPYYYYIYRYAGSGSVASSGAKVTVHQGNTLIAEFNVPTDLGSADYWNVFAIKDGELIINNTITSSANTSYAG